MVWDTWIIHEVLHRKQAIEFLWPVIPCGALQASKAAKGQNKGSAAPPKDRLTDGVLNKATEVSLPAAL